MSDDLVTIARLELAHEGHLLRMRLAAAGIEAFVVGDHVRQVFMLEPGGQIRVQVRESDAEAALDALADDDSHGEDQDFPLEELEAEALAASDPVEQVDADDDGELAPTGAQPTPMPPSAPLAAAPPLAPPITAAPPMPFDGTLRCPQCGVGNVRRRRLGPLLKLVGVLLLGVPLILSRNTWECEICGHRWRSD